jgi:hypothetical protein
MSARKGRKSVAQTPAPKSDRIKGSKTNKPGSAASKSSAKSIIVSDKVAKTLKDKADKYNETHSSKVSVNTLKAVFRRGAGAYSISHRPTITGGAPNSRNAWSFARVNKFLLKKGGTKVKAAYVQDDDLMAKGGKVEDVDIDIPKYLYHSTPSYNRQKIKENGLSIGFDGRVYFTKSLGAASDIANQLHNTYKEKDEKEGIKFYSIFKVDTTKIPNIVFYKDEEYNAGIFTKNPIPKSAIKYYESIKVDDMEKGGELGQDVVCVSCGWGWNLTDSDEKDKYTCHKCGFDNTLFYSTEIMEKFDEFADKRLQGAEKITNDSKEKGGLSMLTYYHYNAKLPTYEQASKGGFDLEKAKQEFDLYYSQLSYNMKQVEFQELMGKMEVLGELIIEEMSILPNEEDFAKGGITKYSDSGFDGFKLTKGGRDWFIIKHISTITGKISWNVYVNSVEGANFIDGFQQKKDAFYTIDNIYTNDEQAEANATFEEEFKEGGVVVGKRHSEEDENGTGERFLVESTGQVVEVEGGEGVLSKESMNSDKKYDLDGEKMTGKQIASKLNHKYGGVEFAEGGEVGHVCGCRSKYYHGGELPSATLQGLSGGEAVVTVKTMESKDLYTFQGKKMTPRQILSKINADSGGKKFEEGGTIDLTKNNLEKHNKLTKMVYFTENILHYK